MIIQILDVGTLYGVSAISLSHNNTNKITSYNLVDDILDDNNVIYSKNNVEFKIKNVLDDLNLDLISNTKIVMIDIDHVGTVEKKIIARLVELDFKGIILLDDIHIPWKKPVNLNEKMKDLWENQLNFDKKLDVTKYGHWSGTGLIVLDKNIDILLE